VPANVNASSDRNGGRLPIIDPVRNARRGSGLLRTSVALPISACVPIVSESWM